MSILLHPMFCYSEKSEQQKKDFLDCQVDFLSLFQGSTSSLFTMAPLCISFHQKRQGSYVYPVLFLLVVGVSTSFQVVGRKLSAGMSSDVVECTSIF